LALYWEKTIIVPSKSHNTSSVSGISRLSLMTYLPPMAVTALGASLPRHQRSMSM
jgi:hypothetical protein